jgi:Fic family protein
MKLDQYPITIDWKLLQVINQIERFDAQWPYLKKKEDSYLFALEQNTLQQSFASCCRMHNYTMHEREARLIIQQNNPYTLSEKALKKAYGYYECKTWIQQLYLSLSLSENTIKTIHTKLLRYSEQDYLKKGNYISQKTNQKTTFFGLNKKGFKTTVPSLRTEREMQTLLKWFEQEKTAPALLKVGYLAYQILVISPFYDQNESLMILLTNFLLLQSQYEWIKYCPLEELFEINYPRILRVQQETEDSKEASIYNWIYLFLEIVAGAQAQLKHRILKGGRTAQLAKRQRAILHYIEQHPECKSGEIAGQLHLANSSTKKILSELCAQKYIKRLGKGAGCCYIVYL